MPKEVMRIEVNGTYVTVTFGLGEVTAERIDNLIREYTPLRTLFVLVGIDDKNLLNTHWHVVGTESNELGWCFKLRYQI